VTARVSQLLLTTRIRDRAGRTLEPSPDNCGDLG
jgi:hypothetical protein